MAKALLTDGLLSVFPAADACPADLCMVGKLLTAPAFCLPVSAEEGSSAPVQKQGVVVQNILHRDAVKGGELVRNANDVAPYVGFGRVVVKMVNGVHKYKVEFLSKVKFSEPSQDDSTKGEKLEFKTTELEGTIATLEDGTWSKSKTFDTQADAIKYLEGLMAAGK